MSRTKRDVNKGRAADRRLSVRAIRRDPPDYRKLGRALIDLAVAQAEADALADATAQADVRAALPQAPTTTIHDESDITAEDGGQDV